MTLTLRTLRAAQLRPGDTLRDGRTVLGVHVDGLLARVAVDGLGLAVIRAGQPIAVWRAA